MQNNNSDFQNELTNLMNMEDERKQKKIETAKLKAKWDFESLKKQFRFIVSQGEYYTGESGRHYVTVMFPQYPNTIEHCEVNEYLTLKIIDRRIEKGLFKKTYENFYDLICKVIDQEGFAAYKEELDSLCEKENISCRIVATPSCKYSSTLGLSSTYKVVPGYIESNKIVIPGPYHIRLCADMEF